MRIFLKYNSEGEILSVSQIEVMPEGVEQPYADIGAGEQVLEVPVTEELEQLDPIQLHDNYRVDVEQKKLVKKTESPT